MSQSYNTPITNSPRSQRLAALGQCLLQRLEMPVLLMDAGGAVLEANPAAMRRIERCEGLWLDVAGRLAVRQGGRWVPLARWQPQVAEGAEVTLLLEADGVPQQLTLRTLALGDDRCGEGWMLATIERIALTRTDAMRRRFRFTQTQARLAEMLCDGMRPTHAAEVLGVKISTVRTHVGQMYEKTGTHSQAQLVALLHAV
jgi:DNA-binding CsgD family transcriptional regulator